MTRNYTHNNNMYGYTKFYNQKKAFIKEHIYDIFPKDDYVLVESPEVEHYRHKTIFDLNQHQNHDFGFKISPVSFQYIMDIMSEIITELRDFKRCWKNIHIKTNSHNEVLIKFEIVFRGKYQIYEFKSYHEYIKHKLIERTSRFCRIKYIGYQYNINNNKINKFLKHIVIHGENKLIQEGTIMNKKIKFVCGIDTFFQGNIYIYEKFYEYIYKQLAKCRNINIVSLGDDSSNICTMIKKINNRLNLYSIFHCSICHDNCLPLMKENNVTFSTSIENYDFLKIKDISLIINPGRKGMKSEEIVLINKSPNIKHIIYMACNLKSFHSNYDSLKNHYVINELMSFDQFPFVKHGSENIFTLSRKT